jgi:hypothetical protein
MSRWLNFFRPKLETFRERLTLDDVVAKDEATQAGVEVGSIHVIDELGSFSRRRKYR